MTAENQMTGKTGEVGRLLKAAREESRQNLRDVAERLRIRYQFLEAIEEGRYQDLPGAAYATGFVRAYAEYLGLDGLEVARRFKEEGAVGKVGNELSFPIPAAESGLPSRSLLLAGVAMLGVVYGVWHYVGSPDKPLADMVQDIPDRIAALMRSTPDAEEALKREPVIAPAAQSPAPAPQVAAAPAAPVAPAAPAVTPPAPPPAAPAKPAHSETAQEPISTAEADIEPPAEEHEDPPAAVAPLPAPTAALPSVPAAGAAPAPVPAPSKAGAPATAAHPATPAPAPVVTPAPSAATKPAVTAPVTTSPATATPASAPAAPPAQQTAVAPVKPGAPAPAPAVVPGATKQTATPTTASPLAALPSQPAAAPASAPASPATPARVEPTTAPVERQGTDAGADGASSQGRVFGEENGGARVVLRARADSWVQVRNADGLLMSRLLRKGDSYMVPNQGGLELMTGNAGGLDIVVDGKTLPTLGKAGEVRKGIPLQPDALKAGVAQ